MPYGYPWKINDFCGYMLVFGFKEVAAYAIWILRILF